MEPDGHAASLRAGASVRRAGGGIEGQRGVVAMKSGMSGSQGQEGGRR
jgi:hypothetical protein